MPGGDPTTFDLSAQAGACDHSAMATNHSRLAEWHSVLLKCWEIDFTQFSQRDKLLTLFVLENGCKNKDLIRCNREND